MRAKLSFDSSTHDIFDPQFSSDEETTPIVKATEEEDYRLLEQYFIESSDSETDAVGEIELKYIT